MSGTEDAAEKEVAKAGKAKAKPKASAASPKEKEKEKEQPRKSVEKGRRKSQTGGPGRRRRNQSEPPPERALAVDNISVDRYGFEALKQGVSSTPGILRWMANYHPESSKAAVYLRTTLRSDERVMGVLENLVGGPNDLLPAEDPEVVRKRIGTWLDAY